MSDSLPTSSAPVRGTQSFVGVMADVWKRPSLTLLEIAWRVVFWSAVLVFVAMRWGTELRPLVTSVQAGSSGIGSGASSVSFSAGVLLGAAKQFGLLFAAASVIWVLISTFGRGAVLRRLSSGVSFPFLSLATISALRVLSLLVVVACWVWAVAFLVKHLITGPLLSAQEPASIPFSALVIGGTLLLFVLWMAASYVFQLAAVISVEKRAGPIDSLRLAAKGGVLRGKLVEINLVIGIVKIALIVLAMVFSACPLPFSTVETQGFLTCWWIGVGVWYAVASDFFHVVRTAAFQRLWKLYEIPLDATT